MCSGGSHGFYRKLSFLFATAFEGHHQHEFIAHHEFCLGHFCSGNGRREFHSVVVNAVNIVPR